jgi:hypothetical protein
MFPFGWAAGAPAPAALRAAADDPKEGDPPRRGQPGLHNVPVDTAVKVLADMADLGFVRLDNLLYVTSREKAARLRAEQTPSAHSGAEPVRERTATRSPFHRFSAPPPAAEKRGAAGGIECALKNARPVRRWKPT